jgi:hypothetical protein
MQSGLFNDKGWDSPIFCSDLTLSKKGIFRIKPLKKGQTQKYSNFLEMYERLQNFRLHNSDTKQVLP